MKIEKKKVYTLYTNTNEIDQQMTLKESTTDTKLDLITYDVFINKGFCEEGVNIFGRILGLDDDEIKDVSFTQREFDNVVAKYGKLILESDVWMEVFQLTTREAWKDHEGIISKDNYRSLCYAKDVIKGRFELGEEVISQDLACSYTYAIKILKGRFERGEKVISESHYYSYPYAKDVIKGRFELGEKAIKSNSYYSKKYKKFLKGLKK